jgi:hypothetical protein
MLFSVSHVDLPGQRCLTVKLTPLTPHESSVRVSPLHPMGVHPLVCRLGQRREQTVLLDDVVQHVSTFVCRSSQVRH